MSLWRQPASPNRPKAGKAAELNTAISQLWQAQATHDKDSFNQQIVPIYTALLEQLKQHQPEDAAEQQLIDLLNDTANACHHRWTLRLPLKRPGSDYRKYEIIYTDALITAMAIESLKQYDNQSPKKLAEQVLPKNILDRLRADAIVWEDWLGYFQKAEKGGLYACSLRKPPEQKQQKEQQPTPITTTIETHKKPPPPGSGRAMLEAIQQALAEGTLSYNQPGDAVQVDRQGRTFLEHPKILTWCIEHLALDADLKRVKNRFDRLKVYTRTADGKQLFRGKLRARDPRARGYVLEDPAVLWSKTPPTGRFVIENLTALE